MMLRTDLRALSSSVVLLALSACKPTQPSTPATPPSSSVRADFIPVSSVGMRPCPKMTAEPKTVVRVVIPKDLLSPDGKRYVKVRSTEAPDPTDDEDAWNMSDENDGAIPEFKRNPFHIWVPTIGKPTNDPGYIKVKVILQDKKYRFYVSHDPARKTPIIGAAVDSNDPRGSWFCQFASDALSMTKNNKKNVLTFYILRMTDPVPTSINLVIVADEANPGAQGGFETPIIIDPKIENNG